MFLNLVGIRKVKKISFTHKYIYDRFSDLVYVSNHYISPELYYADTWFGLMFMSHPWCSFCHHFIPNCDRNLTGESDGHCGIGHGVSVHLKVRLLLVKPSNRPVFDNQAKQNLKWWWVFTWSFLVICWREIQVRIRETSPKECWTNPTHGWVPGENIQEY